MVRLLPVLLNKEVEEVEVSPVFMLGDPEGRGSAT